MWTNQLDCLYQLVVRGFWLKDVLKNLLLLILISDPTER